MCLHGQSLFEWGAFLKTSLQPKFFRRLLFIQGSLPITNMQDIGQKWLNNKHEMLKQSLEVTTILPNGLNLLMAHCSKGVCAARLAPQ